MQHKRVSTRQRAAARTLPLQPTLLSVSLALAGLTLFGGTMQDAQAFTPNPDFSPTVLIPFTGTEGSAQGGLPLAPPVHVNGNLYGITDIGGYPYTDRYGEIVAGGAVLYSLDPSDPLGSYRSFRAQGELGKGQSVLPFWDAKTGALYSGSLTIIDPNGSSQYPTYMGQMFKLNPGNTAAQAPQSVLVPQPATTTLLAGDFQPRGSAAVDGNGYAYFSGTSSHQQCFDTAKQTNTWHDTLAHSAYYERRNMLYRLNLGQDGAQPEPIVNFCDFASAYIYLSSARLSVAKREYHAKGTQPTHVLISRDAKYLYGIAMVDSAANITLSAYTLPVIKTGETIPSDYPTPDYGGIPSSDNSGLPVANLFRIELSALQGAPLTAADADKVEVLHWFAKDRDGDRPQVKLAASGTMGHSVDYSNAIIEVGDWIYGTNKTLWRVYTGSDASVTERFQVVHGFGTGLGGNTIEADGVQPAGPLALAADGNLYGTAREDSRARTDGVQANTGVLYRVVIDQANPNAKPAYEPLQYFDLNTTGAQPAGVSAGEFADGKQRLYGATRLSANAADPATPLERGAIFRVDVPLPTVFTQTLTASATQVSAGQSITLRWKAENAASCTATGSNNGTWQGDKPLESNGTSVVLAQEGSYTFGLNCVRTHGGPDAESATVTVTAVASGTTPDNGGGNNGGDNGGTGGDNSSGGGGGGGALGGLALSLMMLLGLRRQRTRN